MAAHRAGGRDVRRETPAPDQPIGVEQNHADVAITPDGRRIVYLSENAQGRWFTVRSLDAPEGLALTKLGEHVRGLFISPDSRWIGYQSGPATGRGNEIRKVPIDGGASMPVAAISSNLRGASWGPDDTIVIATSNPADGLQRVPAGGGTPEVLTRPAAADGEFDHLWPQHLPDGRHVLFALSRLDGTWAVAVALWCSCPAVRGRPRGGSPGGSRTAE
jgi:serine/threonine-protein kinase